MARIPSSDSLNATLQAEYSSTTSTKTFARSLPPSNVTNTTEKTSYLSALRLSIVQLQDEINTFLTSRMEKDKALAIMTGARADDINEEEKYGEEIEKDTNEMG